MTRFPHGLSSFGIPLLGSIPLVGVPNKNGKVWFVDQVLGNDGNSGQDPTAAFKTIQKAVNSAGNGTGDTIFVFPGTYAENVVVDTKDYLAIVAAMVNGYAKPDIQPAAGKALYVKASAGFVGYMLRFVAPAADTDVVLQEGNGFRLISCVFDGDPAMGAAKGLLRLKGNALDDKHTASEGRILDCWFRNSNGVGIIFDAGDTPGNGVGCTDDYVERNIFQGNVGADVATKDTSTPGPALYSARDVYILGNKFRSKNKATYIDMTTDNAGAAADQTGMIADNDFASDNITVAGGAIKIVGTGFTAPFNRDTVGVRDLSAID